MYRDDSFQGKPRPRGGGSRRPALAAEISVKRSDPAYNAHAYLTKVPVAAIEPFLKEFTKPGDVVLDMYGGSGMTGVAAAICGRRAELRDISVLGRHIGRNYVNLVDEKEFRKVAEWVVARTREHLGNVYGVTCGDCGSAATLSRTVWTFVYECTYCHQAINYYRAFEAADWVRAEMKCPACSQPFTSRGSKRIAEEPVIDTIACDCSSTLRNYGHTEPLQLASADGIPCPDAVISEDREMFRSSALKKHGLGRTSAFFSQRNLSVLAALRAAIEEIEPGELREKLLFSFTAILTRASKRYQWHPKRPLNAANQNYYIAPVFYEWNVFDLFERKVEAALRSDRFLNERMEASGVSHVDHVRYELGSADAIDLPDESIDYVFTDPPFGSNIFYSDMNLFQEVWLGEQTDHQNEAVIDRGGKRANRRTPERYERLIAGSLREAKRVLQNGGWLSIVFSNSNGEMWALMQRSIAEAGFRLGEVTLLSKGQRSVKGLASGFENVVTMDLVLSMQKRPAGKTATLQSPPVDGLEEVVTEILEDGCGETPSHVFLELIRRYFRQDWDVSELSIGDVVTLLAKSGYDVDRASGLLVCEPKKAA